MRFYLVKAIDDRKIEYYIRVLETKFNYYILPFTIYYPKKKMGKRLMNQIKKHHRSKIKKNKNDNIIGILDKEFYGEKRVIYEYEIK